MGKLVSIAEYGTAAKAHIVKSRLEAEGIPCYLYNENLNSILAGVSFARIKLQVPLEHSLKAADIILENPSDPPTTL